MFACQGGPDELRTLRRQIDALEARYLRVLLAYDRSEHWRDEGYANVACALEAHPRLDRGVARGHAELARKLDDLPLVADALSDGAISRSHAQVIANAFTPEREDQLRGVEAELVDAAKIARPRELRAIVKHLTDAIDGDGGAADDERLYERRRGHLSRTLDGMIKVDVLLDPEAGEYWAQGLETQMEREYFDGDPRTRAQRRADALTALIKRNLDAGALGETRDVAPHLSVVVDVRELPGATPELVELVRRERHELHRLSTATIDRLLCDCEITRVITNGPSEVLDVGRAYRTVTRAQWKALVVRDRHCRAPGCRQPARYCEAHHIRYWERGGNTDLDNLELVCAYHHRLRHREEHRARTGPRPPDALRSIEPEPPPP